MGMYSEPYNSPQDGYRNLIFVPIPPFSYPDKQNKWVKNYFATRSCPKCPYMEISENLNGNFNIWAFWARSSCKIIF